MGFKMKVVLPRRKLQRRRHSHSILSSTLDSSCKNLLLQRSWTSDCIPMLDIGVSAGHYSLRSLAGSLSPLNNMDLTLYSLLLWCDNIARFLMQITCLHFESPTLTSRWRSLGHSRSPPLLISLGRHRASAELSPRKHRSSNGCVRGACVICFTPLSCVEYN